jgi:hypothetical protein
VFRVTDINSVMSGREIISKVKFNCSTNSVKYINHLQMVYGFSICSRVGPVGAWLMSIF